MSAPNPELDIFHLEAAVHNGHLWHREYSRVALNQVVLQLWLPPVYAWAGSDERVFVVAKRPSPVEPYRAYSNRPNLPTDPYRRSEIEFFDGMKLYREEIIGGYVSAPRDRVAFGIGSAVMEGGLQVRARDAITDEAAQLNIVLTNFEYGRDVLQSDAWQLQAA